MMSPSSRSPPTARHSTANATVVTQKNIENNAFYRFIFYSNLCKCLRSLIKPLTAVDNKPDEHGIEPELFQLIGQHLKAQIKALHALEALG